MRELLSLQSSLSFLAGSLPPSLAEVEAIEAARAKAAWEAALPPLTSAANFAERQRRVQEREWREWREKEEGQRRAEDGRMQLLIQRMEERQRQQTAAVEALKAERMRAAVERAGQAEERRVAEKRRAVRLLGKQRLMEERRAALMTGGLADVAAPGKKSTAFASSASAASALLSGLGADVVFSAVDFGSAVYAPLARSGAVRAAKGRRAVVDFDIPALADVEQLRRFERRQTEAEHEDAEDGVHRLRRLPHLHLPPPTRQQSTERRHLHRQDERLREEKEQLSGAHTDPAAAHSLNVYKAYQPIQRAPTPSLPREAASQAARTVAVSALQRLLRGRAAQNRTLRGQQRNEGLIDELSHTRGQQRRKETVEAEEGRGDEADEEATEEAQHGSQRGRRLQSLAEDGLGEERALLSADEWSSASVLVDCLLGVVWSDAVLSLSSLWQQEAQLQALASLQTEVEFVRRVRESEEGGRRQAEEERRRERERSVQRRTRQLQQSTAALHTQSILQRAVLRCVEEQWTCKAEELAASASSAAASASPPSSSALIGDLLDAVLFPSVVRHSAAAVAGLQQRRFLLSAHETAQTALDGGMDRAGSTQPPPLSSH